MKKLYLIIGGIVVLAIVGFIAKGLIFGALTGGHYQQNLNGTQTYSNNEGSVTVGNNASMPSEWPSDAPSNFAGGSIVFSGNSNPQTGKNGAVVSYTVKGGTIQGVSDYYKAQLTANGWTLQGNYNVAGQGVLAAQKDGRTFGVSISDSGNGSVTVTAGLELQ